MPSVTYPAHGCHGLPAAAGGRAGRQPAPPTFHLANAGRARGAHRVPMRLLPRQWTSCVALIARRARPAHPSEHPRSRPAHPSPLAIQLGRAGSSRVQARRPGQAAGSKGAMGKVRAWPPYGPCSLRIAITPAAACPGRAPRPAGRYCHCRRRPLAPPRPCLAGCSLWALQPPALPLRCLSQILDEPKWPVVDAAPSFSKTGGCWSCLGGAALGMCVACLRRWPVS